jgi:hypothetical protein
MVRPIEISDSLSNMDVVERIHHTHKSQPESPRQFQRKLAERLTRKITSQNPEPENKRVVFQPKKKNGKNKKSKEENTLALLRMKTVNTTDGYEDTSPGDGIDIKA